VSRVIAACLALISACVTPQIVQPGGTDSLERFRACSEWSEIVELDVGTGERIRGLFVSAGDGAPVVLHLLGSQASVTAVQRSDGLEFDVFSPAIDFACNGLSSLIVDYRGVGASDGECDSRHLAEDAWTAWNEALRRAGGYPSRVVVRASSIGTLAAATLLERGARPAMVELIAPVRSETIAHNWLAHYRGAWRAAIVSPFLRRPVAVDLEHALANAQTRLVVFAGRRDAFLPDDERELVKRAVREARGRWIERDLDHLQLVHAGYEVVDEELGELARKFPESPFAYRYPPSCVMPGERVPVVVTLDWQQFESARQEARRAESSSSSGD
jgi:pimeloyl-ACP methyl ester carboxylesterase